MKEARLKKEHILYNINLEDINAQKVDSFLEKGTVRNRGGKFANRHEETFGGNTCSLS